MFRLVVAFAVGALVIAAVATLARAVLTAVLERRSHRLDRWRRVWFHPERELARLIEALLIVAFVAAFVHTYTLPGWVIPVVAGVWALHLSRDFWSWARLRRLPRNTRALHLRGFALLDLGPLWVRAGLGLVGAGLYFLIPPLRHWLDSGVMLVPVAIFSWFS